MLGADAGEEFGCGGGEEEADGETRVGGEGLEDERDFYSRDGSRCTKEEVGAVVVLVAVGDKREAGRVQ